MKKNLVLTVGNEMMGDDAAGPLLARMMLRSPLEHWDVLDGGSAPENHLFKVREIAPEKVIVVDAAEMELPGGAIRRIPPEHIGSLFLLTTHSLPVSYLLESMQEFVPVVDFLGIQPEMVAFGYPVSPQVKQAVERIYGWLISGKDICVVADLI